MASNKQTKFSVFQPTTDIPDADGMWGRGAKPRTEILTISTRFEWMVGEPTTSNPKPHAKKNTCTNGKFQSLIQFKLGGGMKRTRELHARFLRYLPHGRMPLNMGGIGGNTQTKKFNLWSGSTQTDISRPLPWSFPSKTWEGCTVRTVRMGVSHRRPLPDLGFCCRRHSLRQGVCSPPQPRQGGRMQQKYRQ